MAPAIGAVALNNGTTGSILTDCVALPRRNNQPICRISLAMLYLAINNQSLSLFSISAFLWAIAPTADINIEKEVPNVYSSNKPMGTEIYVANFAIFFEADPLIKPSFANRMSAIAFWIACSLPFSLIISSKLDISYRSLCISFFSFSWNL